MPNKNPPPDELTAKDAAAIVGVAPSTLINRILRGDLEGRQVGGRWIVRRADAIAFAKVFRRKAGRRPARETLPPAA